MQSLTLVLRSAQWLNRSSSVVFQKLIQISRIVTPTPPFLNTPVTVFILKALLIKSTYIVSQDTVCDVFRKYQGRVASSPIKNNTMRNSIGKTY